MEKILNLACEAVLLEGGCQYQMIRKDVERSTDNAFSYCAARAAYGGRTAISYKYSGAADIIVIKSGNSVIWQTENIREHYARVDAKESYTICAMVYTPTGKVTVAATEAFSLSEPVYCEEVPKISLIIPMFNSSEFIAGTVERQGTETADEEYAVPSSCTEPKQGRSSGVGKRRTGRSGTT